MSSLYRRLAELRWPIFFIVVGAAAIHQALLLGLLRFLPPSQHNLVQLALYSLTGMVVAWFGLRQLTRAAARQEQAESDLRGAYAGLQRVHSQLQIIHEVSRRVTNASDVQELLEIAARIPVDLLDARGATVITFDDDSNQSSLQFTLGMDDAVVRLLRHQVTAEHSADRCRTCQPLSAHIHDDNECPMLISAHEATDEDPPGQIVCLPLGRGESQSGVVIAFLDKDIALSEEDSRLMGVVAAEITGAMENAHLRSKQMATLYAVDQATQERRSLNLLLNRALESTVAGWDVPAGAILLTDGDGSRWNLGAVQGLERDSSLIDLAIRLADRAEISDNPVFIREQSGDEALVSVATVLLQTEGEMLGALVLGSNREGYFKPSQLGLLKAVGSQIALAIRNVQLYSRLRETAVVEERYRLSREMHDGLAQTLGYLGMQAEHLERILDRGEQARVRSELVALRQVIAEAYLEVRESIDGLRLTVDQPGGFVGALQAHAAEFARRSDLQVDCSCIDEPEQLPAEVALHLLRITQEALANVRRHANASHVEIKLERDNGNLELSIRDDGRGFDISAPMDRQHVGLMSMQERVRSLDGQLTLSTSPGQGTQVIARIPIEK
ncbi:MAG: GAF domain-containing sensor histidine kinase [Chloroflexota bacterium]|nr:GAF domain-containing sensor histidine kinase [Chloroflexota bacterium]